MAAKRFLAFVLSLAMVLAGCGSGVSTDSNNNGGNNGGGGSTAQIQGVLRWKGSNSGNGIYTDSTLTTSNVNGTQFGKKAEFPVEGIVIAQPLYVKNLNLGAAGTHNVVIVVTEHNQVYAFDADSTSQTPLWRRNYLEAGVTPAPDNFGGRTALGGEVGITGTPVIDPQTGAMYFVTTLSRNGVVEQWLRSIDIRTGQDYGPGSMKIQASLPGDGPGSVNGQVPFDPAIQNQRSGLVLQNGNVLIAWGSFSDWGVYRGWLMAYNAQSLQQVAAFSPAKQYQAEDDAFGPADHGGGAAIWGAGAAPSLDSSGYIYVVAADGSFNADRGGSNYGDSVLKMRLGTNGFEVVDFFTPANEACVNEADLEIGSGGVTLLPNSDLAVVINKEGRLYLLNTSNLGHFNPTDAQIPQQFMVGNKECFPDMGGGFAEGPDWMRLYGNVTSFNDSVYVAPSNGTMRQYRLTGGTLSTTPASQSAYKFGSRGGNSVISSSGIVWVGNKSYDGGRAVLHAFDANNLANELWNSNANIGRDGLGTGSGFGVPVVADGKVIYADTRSVKIYGLLQ